MDRAWILVGMSVCFHGHWVNCLSFLGTGSKCEVREILGRMVLVGLWVEIARRGEGREEFESH